MKIKDIDIEDIVKSINIRYEQLHSLSNDDLRRIVKDIEMKISEDKSLLDSFLVDVFAIVKETQMRFTLGDIEVSANDYDKQNQEQYSFVTIDNNKAIYKNCWGIRGNEYKWDMIPYDEQLYGGILLHYGYAAEMATGEGKTLVATLPVFLNALTHDGVHIMTTNEYLSQRDYEQMRPIFFLYGLTSALVTHMDKAYQSDIIYGDIHTFVFDYLHDHLADSPNECVQTRQHNYAIIDEIDSILIDDANIPHIIGSTKNLEDNGKYYNENKEIIEELLKDKQLYKVDLIKKAASFTEDGKNWIEKKINKKIFKYKRLYEVDNFESMSYEEQEILKNGIFLNNVFHQLLLAYTVYKKNVDYCIVDNDIVILDTNTGRLLPSNRWEHGLHTAIEAKENVATKKDFSGTAVITLKNYFRLYKKVAGMSGTIKPVKDEFDNVYNLKTGVVPLHKPSKRKDGLLSVYKTSKLRDIAVINKIKEVHVSGRPILVCCPSVEKCTNICNLLEKEDIDFKRLDALTPKGEEANIIFNAGQKNAITISTSISGRGTDIKLSHEIKEAGGLFVIGTELFSSTRIDRQLKGRSARQGEPGDSQFFASLDDEVIKYLKQDELETLQKIVNTIEDDDISTDEVRRIFNMAQKRNEDYTYDSRQESIKKDDYIDPYRRDFYQKRQAVLFDHNEANNIINHILEVTGNNEKSLKKHISSLYCRIKNILPFLKRNEYNINKVDVPFSIDQHLFTVSINVEECLSHEDSFNEFYEYFKYKVVIDSYDLAWQPFVEYLLGDLDNKEIESLERKCERMKQDTELKIIQRLLHASIPIGNENKSESNDESFTYNGILSAPKVPSFNSPCPCGSGKRYGECHGQRIYKNN